MRQPTMPLAAYGTEKEPKKYTMLLGDTTHWLQKAALPIFTQAAKGRNGYC